MNSPAPGIESANPFATRLTRSGMVPYQFPEGQGAGGFIERLHAAGWWGQVIGPHGSGKSTLLATLLPELSRQVGGTVVARLHEDCRQLPGCIEDVLSGGSAAVSQRLIVIDGCEQLSFWRRFWLRRRCRRLGLGLLVSSHRRLSGLPVVHRTRSTPDTAWRVVNYLMREQQCPFTPADIAARLAAHNGNLRELLFDLYDWYEASR